MEVMTVGSDSHTEHLHTLHRQNVRLSFYNTCYTQFPLLLVLKLKLSRELHMARSTSLHKVRLKTAQVLKKYHVSYGSCRFIVELTTVRRTSRTQPHRSFKIHFLIIFPSTARNPKLVLLLRCSAFNVSSILPLFNACYMPSLPNYCSARM
jgi:hypothetical protein